MNHSAEVAKDYMARHGTPEEVGMLRDHFDTLLQKGGKITITITMAMEEV